MTLPRYKKPEEIDLTKLEGDTVPVNQTLMNIEDILIGAMTIMAQNQVERNENANIQ